MTKEEGGLQKLFIGVLFAGEERDPSPGGEGEKM